MAILLYFLSPLIEWCYDRNYILIDNQHHTAAAVAEVDVYLVVNLVIMPMAIS